MNSPEFANAWIARGAVVVLFTALAVVGLADVWLLTQAPRGGTVSEIIVALAKAYPILAFFTGILVGHLLWPIGNGR